MPQVIYDRDHLHAVFLVMARQSAEPELQMRWLTMARDLRKAQATELDIQRQPRRARLR